MAYNIYTYTLIAFQLYRSAFLKLGVVTPRGVAEQFLRGREVQLIFESTPGCLLKFNIKFKFKFTKDILTNLLPFSTTYLCESGFSALLQIKTSSRYKLKVEDDLRCALTNTEPEIQDLVKEKQLHPSH